MPKSNVGGIQIEYDCFGDDNAEVLLLISGLDTQMIRWTESFCQILSNQGYRVIRFDNRDAGLSSHFDSAGTPDLQSIAHTASRGETPDVPYTLLDMADDAVGLLDSLGIKRAHLVGRSMGGMIAQLLASEYPDRVLSLTAIMSSTGNRELPQSSPAIMAAMTRPAPNPFSDENGYLVHSCDFNRAIAGQRYSFDEKAHRDQALIEVKRAWNPAAFWRQIAAIAATGDLRARIASITAPTLVVHGSDDPLVPPAAGKDIATHIEGAELLILEGMGHALPSPLYETVVNAIVRNARRSLKTAYSGEKNE